MYIYPYLSFISMFSLIFIKQIKIGHHLKTEVPRISILETLKGQDYKQESSQQKQFKFAPMRAFSIILQQILLNPMEQWHIITDTQSQLFYSLCQTFVLQLALFYQVMCKLHPSAHAVGEFIQGFGKFLIFKHFQHRSFIIHRTQHQQQIHRLVEQETHLRLVLVDDLFQRHDHLQLHQPLVPLLAIAFHQSLKDSQAIVAFFALQNFRVCPDVKEHVAMVCRTNGQQLFSTDELALSEERVCLESKVDSFLLVVFSGFDQGLREHEAIQEILDGQLPIQDCLLKRFSHIVQLNVETKQTHEIQSLFYSQVLIFVLQELFTEAPDLNFFNAPEYLLRYPLRLSKNLDPQVFYSHSFSQEQKHPSRFFLEILFILKHLLHKIYRFARFMFLFKTQNHGFEQFDSNKSKIFHKSRIIYGSSEVDYFLSIGYLPDNDGGPS